MLWRIVLFSIALGFGSLGWATESRSCSFSLHEQLAGRTVSLEPSAYDARLERWRTILSQSHLDVSLVRDSLLSENTLLNWLALNDALLSDTAAGSLFEVAKSLTKHGVCIKERLAFFSGEMHGTAKMRWLSNSNLKQITVVLPGGFARRAKEPPTKTLQWLFHQLIALNHAFTDPLMLSAKTALDVLVRAEQQAFEIGYQLGRRLGATLRFEIKSVSGYSLGWEVFLYSWKLVFPSRSQIRWKPANLPFEAYVKSRAGGLDPQAAFASHEKSLRAVYAPRLRVYRFATAYRTLLLAGTVTSAAAGFVHVAHSYWTGSWRAPLQALETLGSVASDPMERAQAVQEYNATEGGYDVVNQYYREQIEALRRQQQQTGDPDGTIEKEIQFKQQQMNELR